MTKQAPQHLRRDTKAFWSSVIRDFELEEHHVRLLTAACESWDRGVEAREAVTAAGPFFTNRHGERLRPSRWHPGMD